MALKILISEVIITKNELKLNWFQKIMLAIAGIQNLATFNVQFIFNVKGHHVLMLGDYFMLGKEKCKIVRRKDDDGEAYFTGEVVTPDPTFTQKGYALINPIESYLGPTE